MAFASVPPLSRPAAFLSDIHGNLPALKAVLAELDRRGITEIFCAGDLLLGGEDPVEVFQILMRRKARCVRGLSDNALVQIDPRSLSAIDAERAERLRRFKETRESIGEVALMHLKQLPEKLRVPLLDGSELLMVHGSPADPSVEISHDMSEDELYSLLDDDPAEIIVCGATHVPFQRELEGQRIVNLGSVGQAPEGGHAHYTVITPRMDGALIEQAAAPFGEENSDLKPA